MAVFRGGGARHGREMDKQVVYDWSLRHIRWGDVFKYQHWGGFLLFIPAVVITGVAHYSFQTRPVVRQALLYDATISYPMSAKQIIPNSQAVAFNWICLVVAVLLVELGVFWRRHSLTVALAGIVHEIWSCVVNFIIIVAITEVTKPFSGRLRPDFLSRCHPPDFEGASSDVNTLLSDHAASLGKLYVGQVAGACTNPNQDIINDGRLSFPSGHASNSMSVAWYTVLYLMWSLYLRVDAPYPRRLYWGSTFWGRLMGEVLHAVAYAFVLLAICLSWFIGATRFWDNEHNISDIIGGFLLAIIFTTPYIIKAVGLHTALREHVDGQLDTKTAVLAPQGPEEGGIAGSMMGSIVGPMLPVSSAPGHHSQPAPASAAVRQGNGTPEHGRPGADNGDVVLQMSDLPRQHGTRGQP